MLHPANNSKLSPFETVVSVDELIAVFCLDEDEETRSLIVAGVGALLSSGHPVFSIYADFPLNGLALIHDGESFAREVLKDLRSRRAESSPRHKDETDNF